VDRGVLEESMEIESIEAPADACFVEEGCLGGTGTRKVLRFTTRVHNIGCAPFVIGVPDGWCGLGCETGQRRLGTDPTDDSVRVGGFNTSNSFKNGNGHYSGSTKARGGGTTTGRYPSRRRLDNGWSWHECHQHWHYDNYAHYALRDLCTDDTVAFEDRAVVGHKNGWCVADTNTYGTGKVIHSDGNLGWQDRCYYYNQYSAQVQPNPERGLHGFTCTKMGISSGCSDEYAASLDCQWIDITDAPDGDYWLTVATNWDEAGREETSPENDYTNNEANVAIQIQGDTVTILSSAQVHQQCPNDSAGARAVATGYHDDEPEMMTGSRIRAESFPEPGL